MDCHVLAKRGYLLGKVCLRLGAQSVDPQFERMPGRSEQPFPLVRQQLVCERDGGQLRRVQDLIGIRIADATQQTRIGKGSLECVVFSRECGAKRIEIAGEDVDPSGVDGM